MAPETRQPAEVRAPGARSVTATAAVVLVAFAAGLLLLGGGWAAAAQGGDAWKGALRSPLFLFCGLLTAACALGLAVLCGALWAVGASARGAAAAKQPCPGPAGGAHGCRASVASEPEAQPTREEGTATLEFALVLPIALMFVLTMTQGSLVMGGNLCVNYAAFCAARSAIVNVPRDLGPEEPRNVVGDAASSGKLRRVQMAAVWAVLPVSCAHPDGPRVSAVSLEAGLEAAFSASGVPTPPWAGADMGRRLGYAQEHTFVELAPPANRGSYDGNEDLRVRVRHDFYLSVPYAARIFSKVAGEGIELDFGQGQFALKMRSACILTNEGSQDFVDVERFPRDRVNN